MATPVETVASVEVNIGDAALPATSNPQVIGLSNGHIVVAWEEAADGTVGGSTGIDIVGVLIDPFGNVIAGPQQLNFNRALDDELDFDMAATNDGGFVLAYLDQDIDEPDDSSILADRLNATLGFFGARVLEEEGLAGDAALSSPQVAVDQTDNSYIVTYESTVTGNANIRAHRVDQFSNISLEFDAARNSNADDTTPDLAVLENGNYVSVYQEPDSGLVGIEARILDTAGGIVATLQVSSGAAENAGVATLTNGNFVVTWDAPANGSGDILGRIYTEGGTSVDTFTVAASADVERGHALVALPDGGFVVAWENDTDGTLEAQAFLADGTADGAVFRPSTDPVDQIDIAVTADGRIAFTWVESGAGGDIRFSLWDPRDGAVTTEAFQLGLRSFVDANGTIIGSSGDDDLALPGAGGGVFAFAGNDLIRVDNGTVGADVTLDGGDGIDTIDHSAADARFTFNTDLGLGTVRRGDSLAGASELFGTLTGIENAIGTIGGDVLSGSDAANTLTGLAGMDILDGRDGNDVVLGGSGEDVLRGGVGNDRVDGAGDADILFGGAGDDTINGGNGDDVIEGDAGSNILRGQAGADTVTGGDEADEVNGGIGTDTLDAGGGDDLIRGQGDADLIFAGAGADTAFGGSGNDEIFGGADDDVIRGQGNNDILHGDGGNDMLSGAAGQDSLFGGAGDDQLFGGTAGDYLEGGAGNDLLNAGDQVDRFFFDLGHDADTIAGFGDDQDTIQLTQALVGGTLTGQEVLDAFAVQSGGSVQFDFGGGDTIRVSNITLAQLADDIDVI